MFYIEKLSRLTKRDVTLMHIAPAILVFVAFFTLTIWNWLQLKNDLETNRKEILAKNVQDTSNEISQSVLRYEDILNASAGLFTSSEYVSHQEWKNFVDIFDLSGRYRGIEAMGFAKVVPKDEAASFTKSVKSKENHNFKIYPAGSRTDYAPIVYADPGSIKISTAIGYDMFSNNQMKSAMDEALSSGKPAISGKLEPGAYGPFGNQPEFIAFSPIYNKNADIGSPDQKKQNIFGYIYAEIASYKLIEQFYNPADKNFGFQVYDADTPGEALIYKSPNFETVEKKTGSQVMIRQITINNRVWTISAASSPDAISPKDRQRPVGALWGGIVFSTFLSLFIYTLLLNRSRALSEKDEKQMQSAKDELLALASHQLRTPATGVKQYIGMLLEGYAGKLTRSQKKYLNQAYASNERQLGIINDMLFVARADTGDIEFNFDKTDLLKLMKDILREQSQTIKENGQNLIREIGNAPIYVKADERYIRMAIENILSNATKYTNPGGTIIVTLKKTKSRAVIKVEDNGVGIKEKYHGLLFRKFSRIPNELTNQVSGSGIGLYLAKKVVVAHNGKIEFKSSDKKGSVCTISLKLYKNIRKNGL